MTTHNKLIVAVATIIILALAGYGAAHSGLFKPSKAEAPSMDSAQAGQSGQSDQSGQQMAPGDHPETDHPAGDGAAKSPQDISVAFRIASAREATGGVPQTIVAVIVNGKTYQVGAFSGNCVQVGGGPASGIDGKGLLAGEIAAVQCWYAGSGDEVGVFAHEDGGADIMIGELGEGDSKTPFFRGNFKVMQSISF